MTTGMFAKCDVCGVTGSGEKVIRLNVTQTRHKGGRTITRGAGSIFLCRQCWEMICRPRMRKVALRNREDSAELVA